MIDIRDLESTVSQQRPVHRGIGSDGGEIFDPLFFHKTVPKGHYSRDEITSMFQ
jgi:hypothetical protein